MARREREEVKPDDGFSSKLVAVNRITKVVKGGRNMRFSALVVVGDGKGSVGIGAAKAAEVPEAIKKAELLARRSLIKVAMDGNTIPHETIGQFGKSSVLLKPAPEGTGVIAGSSARSVVELAASRTSPPRPTVRVTPSTASRLLSKDLRAFVRPNRSPLSAVRP